jgi:DNA-binding cell septation regulator SpoVG
MSHTDPTISNFRLVNNHPYLRALADITLSGFVVRGIKLEEGGGGQLHLGFPGRKVQGAWQLVCESENEATGQRLLSRLSEQYADLREAA